MALIQSKQNEADSDSYPESDSQISRGKDVFISYARKDKEFVLKFFQALKEHDRHAWVDWEGIPPSTDWMKQIYSAINEAKAFVFIISPASLSSEVCQKELEHAITQNKRIIPLQVDQCEAPSNLSKIQWIPFNENHEFLTGIQKLLSTLDRDPGWVERHTRFLRRAQRWADSRKDASILLRGKELEEAESWLAESEAKDPQPNARHTLYISTSRQVETKRNRQVHGWIVTSVIAVVTLAGAMMWNADKAQRQAQRAKANALVALASGVLKENDPVVGALLLIELAKVGVPQAEGAINTTRAIDESYFVVMRVP